jgi:hypothetical protein
MIKRKPKENLTPERSGTAVRFSPQLWTERWGEEAKELVRRGIAGIWLYALVNFYFAVRGVTAK